MSNYNNDVEQQVIAMTNKGRSLEDITVLLFMNDEYPTKAECRAVVSEILETNDLTPVKKVPMSTQLREWYMSQGKDALELTKKDIEKQVLAIGMSGGSVKYYTDMYFSASEIAKKLLAL